MVGHILPPVPEILRGEGMAVRPLVSLAQGEGEDPVTDVVDPLQNVGNQVEILRLISDQSGIAVDHHLPAVLGRTHHRMQGSAVLADLLALGRQVDNGRTAGNARLDRRQVPGIDSLFEKRHLNIAGLSDALGRHSGAERQAKPDGQKTRSQTSCEKSLSVFHDASFMLRMRSSALTKWPSPIFTRRGANPSPTVNGAAHSDGIEQRSSITREKSSGLSRLGSGTAASSAWV